MHGIWVEQSENKIFLQNIKKCTRWDKIKTHTHTQKQDLEVATL